MKRATLCLVASAVLQSTTALSQHPLPPKPPAQPPPAQNWWGIHTPADLAAQIAKGVAQGRVIRSLSKSRPGLAVTFGQIVPHQAAGFSIGLRPASQKWYFMPDTTIRYANDPSQCLGLYEPSGTVTLSKCDGSPHVVGWSYRADQSIRKASVPSSCMMHASDAYGYPIPVFYQLCPLEHPEYTIRKPGVAMALVLNKQDALWSLEP